MRPLSRDIDARRPSLSLPRGWQTIESIISVIFAFLLAFAVIILGGNIVFVARGDPEARWLLMAWLLLFCAEGGFCLWLKHALEAGHHPIAPHLAKSQLKWPLPLRPIVAAWWLLHFAAAAAAAIAIDVFTETEWISLKLEFAILLFSAVYCANLFLLLAVSAIYPHPPLVDWIWRWRLVVDLLLVAAAWVIARTWMPPGG